MEIPPVSDLRPTGPIAIPGSIYLGAWSVYHRSRMRVQNIGLVARRDTRDPNRANCRMAYTDGNENAGRNHGRTQTGSHSQRWTESTMTRRWRRSADGTSSQCARTLLGSSPAMKSVCAPGGSVLRRFLAQMRARARSAPFFVEWRNRYNCCSSSNSRNASCPQRFRNSPNNNYTTAWLCARSRDSSGIGRLLASTLTDIGRQCEPPRRKRSARFARDANPRATAKSSPWTSITSR
jgi:hypothetical protein